MPATALFTRNVGTVDRALRITLGVALLFFALTGRGAWGWLGLIPIATGLLGSCPAYSLLGISTCATRK